MRRSLGFRVLALVLLALVNAFEPECHDLLRHRVIDLALEPDKGFVFVFQLFLQLAHRHFEQLGKLAQLCRLALDILRDCPDARCRHTRRQDQAVAIENASPVRRQRERARKADLTLALEEIVGHDLDIDRTPGQRHKAQRYGGNNKPAAPDWVLAREQGARRIGNAAAHGVCPGAPALAGAAAAVFATPAGAGASLL